MGSKKRVAKSFEDLTLDDLKPVVEENAAEDSNEADEVSENEIDEFLGQVFEAPGNETDAEKAEEGSEDTSLEVDAGNEVEEETVGEDDTVSDTDELSIEIPETASVTTGQTVEPEQDEAQQTEVVIGVTHAWGYDVETDQQILIKIEEDEQQVDPQPVDNQSVDESIQSVDESIQKDNDQRELIIKELTELYSMTKSPYITKSWEHMTTVQLQDLLDIARKDFGGSIEVARLINQVKEDYEVALKSDMMKSRLKITDQKAHDFAKVAQKLTKMLGNDVVISGARTKDYHNLVTAYVKHIVTLTLKINVLAQFFNITIPVDEDFVNSEHIPVLDDMPASPQESLYILNVVMANLDRAMMASKFASEALSKANSQIEFLENNLRQARDSVESSRQDVQRIREETKRLIGDSSYWIIKDKYGRILRKKDAEKPLQTPADLDLQGTIDTALFMSTQRSAEILVERLLVTRRFRKESLNAYRVSIVQQTFHEGALLEEPSDD